MINIFIFETIPTASQFDSTKFVLSRKNAQLHDHLLVIIVILQGQCQKSRPLPLHSPSAGQGGGTTLIERA